MLKACFGVEETVKTVNLVHALVTKFAFPEGITKAPRESVRTHFNTYKRLREQTQVQRLSPKPAMLTT